jgi:NADH-quinone oxidoreductase subunit M
MGLLSWILVTPVVGAVAIAFLPRRHEQVAKGLALAASLIAFILSLVVLGRFEVDQAGFQLAERHEWIRSLGASYSVAVDGISLWLVILTTFLMPVCVLASWRIAKDPKRFFALMLVLGSAVVTVFVATDLLLFYVAWEAMLIPMYFLIGYWGSERRIYAAVKFFIYTLLGGLVMLAGIIALVFAARDQLGGITFDLRALEQVSLGMGTQRWLFLAFMFAFAIKVPIWPLHTWLPDAHTEAPTAASVLLAGVLLKLGAYGMLRYGVGLFPAVAVDWKDTLAILGIIGILYGAIVATMQTDLKRLVAYSSVSHLGFVVLGIAMLTTTSVQGASLQMVNHGLATGALFLIVGIVYDRRHTRQIDQLGGIGDAAPLLAGAMLFASLASLGLPGLNGFVGEFLVLSGTFAENRVFAVVAVGGVVLAALYLLWAYQRAFQGPLDNPANRIADLDGRERLVLAPVLALLLVLGLFPKPMLDRMTPSIERLLERVHAVEPGPLAEGER